jgi:anti-anti-sigma factor
MGNALAETLTIETVDRERALDVALHGTLDLGTAQEFRKTMRAALDRGVKDFLIDLRGVEFCDATGIAALIGLLKRVHEQDGTLRLLLTRGSRVLLLLDRLGVGTLFSITETPEPV